MKFSEFFTPQVIWFLAGLGFLILELIVPGLIIIFFGLGAWITSLCIVLFNPGFNMQLLIFAITSVLTLLLLRRVIKHKFFDAKKAGADVLEDEFIGKTIFVPAVFKKGIPGKVEFKGTHWNAVSNCELNEGDLAKIISKESLTLHITKAD